MKKPYLSAERYRLRNNFCSAEDLMAWHDTKGYFWEAVDWEIINHLLQIPWNGRVIHVFRRKNCGVV